MAEQFRPKINIKDLKAVDTIGNCQRLHVGFTVGVS